MSSQPTTTRTRILQATLTLLAHETGKPITMGEIGKQAGLSRQAIYLHFCSKSQLLAACCVHLDETLKLNRLMKPFRKAKSGRQRLARFIEFWGQYVALTHGASKALIVAQNTDPNAAAAWKTRTSALRDGCAAAIDGVEAEGSLAKGWSRKTAADALWAMLSVPAWEIYTKECGWTQDEYIKRLKKMARRNFVKR